MSSVIGSLRVDMGLNSAKFTRGMTQVQKDLARARKQFIAVSGVAVAAFGAVTAAALRGADGIDKAAKAARRIDSSIGGFRALEMAAGEAGVAVSTLADAVQTMDREIAKGSAGATAALQKLNLAATDLQGLDADEKMALLADRIQEMGLSTADTSVLLQQLGIRSREMVLALGAGGQVFRDARRDVDDYGLAISKVDSDAIEKANDALGRLGLITQYAGQQLAIALVPAMGRLAEAMTDSLREGGLLRTVIDGLANNIDILSAAVGAAVTVMGVRYVAALVAAKGATLSFAGALAVARGALAALLGPLGLVYIAIGAGAAAWIAHRAATNDSATAMNSAESAAKDLSIELTAMARDDLPNASRATVQLANDNLALARSAYAAAAAQNALAIAALGAADQQLGNEGMSGIEAELLPGQVARAAALENLLSTQRALAAAEEELNNRIFEGNQVKTEAAAVVERLRGEVEDLENEVSGQGSGSRGATPALKELDLTLQDTDKTAISLADTFENGLTSAVDSVSRAFGDFIMRGLRDFRSFASSILDSFKRMLSEMIATAARNRIMISLGMGGSLTGTAASAGTGFLGSMGGGAGLAGMAGGTGLMGGLGNALGGGLANVFSVGANSAAAGGGFMATLGAAVPVIGAVALVFGALRKTTKTLDSGIKVAVDGIDTTVRNFSKTQTSRFFGLSKKTSTRETVDRNSPIGAAVGEIQTAAMQAARVLGVGADAFEGFSYKFQLSLKGMNEQQRQAAIAEKLGELGDSFAGLVPNIENLNQLLEQAAQISANIRALTDRQGLFRTQQDAVFAASQAGNQREPEAVTQDLLREVIRAVREGDINNGRLTSQLVAIQQRGALAPT